MEIGAIVVIVVAGFLGGGESPPLGGELPSFPIPLKLVEPGGLDPDLGTVFNGGGQSEATVATREGFVIILRRKPR